MAKRNEPQIRIGISGWTFPPWRGVFYPKDLTQKQELNYASRMVNSIEINGTFYGLQKPSSFANWYDATPDGFVFAIKGPQFITHIRRLKDAEKPLANFLASGILALKEKLGPILWQLPPSFVFNAETIESFFRLLPHDTKAAAKLAMEHEDRIKSALTTTDENRPMRHAIEVRHASFAHPEFVDLLRKYKVALVIADTAGKWPYGEDVTADFVYVRLHGDEKLYVSGYTPEALDAWEKKLKLWKTGKQPADGQRWSKEKPSAAASRDLFVYFDNDVKVRSPFDAMSLAYRLGSEARGENQKGKDEPPVTPKLTKKALAERVRSKPPSTKKPKK